MSVVRKIVSGGQTGVDRGALEAAIDAGLAHGGFCPRDRRAEDGVVPARFQLEELASRDYGARTEANVVHSDGTLIVCEGRPSGGTALTIAMARKHVRPLAVVDLASDDRSAAVARVRAWLEAESIAVLNVAGPRESRHPGIAERARDLIRELLAAE